MKKLIATGLMLLMLTGSAFAFPFSTLPGMTEERKLPFSKVEMKANMDQLKAYVELCSADMTTLNGLIQDTNGVPLPNLDSNYIEILKKVQRLSYCDKAGEMARQWYTDLLNAGVDERL